MKTMYSKFKAWRNKYYLLYIVICVCSPILSLLISVPLGFLFDSVEIYLGSEVCFSFGIFLNFLFPVV